MVGGLARVCAVRTTTGADERKKRIVVAGQFFVGALQNQALMIRWLAFFPDLALLGVEEIISTYFERN